MKLNKVLALALSGIMAVSMLAGCSNSNGGNDNEEKPVVNGFAATVASKLDENKDNVSIVSDANLDSALSSVMSKIADVNITSNRDTVALKNVGITEEPVVTLNNKDKDLNCVAESSVVFKSTSKKDQTYTVVYYISGDLTTDRVASLVAEKIDDVDLPERSAVDSEGAYYAYDYTAEVSIATASTKDNGASLYFVAISATQNVAEKEL